MEADPEVAQECVEGYLFVPSPFSLLILQRPAARESAWVPVSGKLEPYDRDHASALTRELWEETGLSTDAPLLDLDWSVFFDGPDGRTWHLRAFGVPLEGRWVPQLSDEHVAWEWVSAERAIGRLHFPDNRDAVRQLLHRLGPEPPEQVPGDPPSL